MHMYIYVLFQIFSTIDYYKILSVVPCCLPILYIVVCIYSENAMSTHSSTLTWKIHLAEEPDGLQSMGSHRVGHDGSDLAAAAAAMPDSL